MKTVPPEALGVRVDCTLKSHNRLRAQLMKSLRQSSFTTIVPAALLAVAGIILTGTLVQHAVTGQATGPLSGLCGPEGGVCDEILSSRWATLPPRPASDEGASLAARTEISVAALGLAYFAAVLVWLLAVGRPDWERRGWHLVPLLTVLIGCFGSVFFISVMALLGKWCPLCLGTHTVNFLLLGFMFLSWPVQPAASGERSIALRPTPAPSPRLALAGLLLMIATATAVAAGSLGQQVLNRNAQLAREVEQFRSDTDVLAWMEVNQPRQDVIVRLDDPRIQATAAPHATLVVFTDMQCSHCIRFEESLKDQIVPMFQGQLEVVYKHFPLNGECNPGMSNMHPQACTAAYLAEAARIQGGSEAFLTAKHRLERREIDPSQPADVKKLADALGLDAEQLLADRDSAAVKERIAADVLLAKNLNVGGTPTVFLNGRMVESRMQSVPAFWSLAASRVTGRKVEQIAKGTGGHDHNHEHQVAKVGGTIDPLAIPEVEDPETQARRRELAQRVLAHFDENQDGVLQKEEWSKMQGDLSFVDKDKDGIITLEELMAEIKVTPQTEPSPSDTEPKEPDPTSLVVVGQELNFSGPTLDGSEFRMEDQRGKVVVVAFWGSWCGFCTRETAYLKRLYHLYHDQGLEIVGVNVDSQKADVERFVEENGLPWPQIHFDEEGKRGLLNPVSLQFGVYAFPTIHVVDQEGNVIDVEVRGNELETVVAEALGVEPTPAEQAEEVVQGIIATLWKPEEITPPTWLTVEQGMQLPISGPTSDGGYLDIEEYRGHPVVVAFWASWCPHCVNEMKNIREVYERYREDGLKVIGIGCDSDKKSLLDYVESNDIPWKQIYFDQDGFRGFTSPLARRFKVQGIPVLYLLDQDGKVAHTNPRGDVLDVEVAKLLGKEPATKKSPGTMAGPGGVKENDDLTLARMVIRRYDGNEDGVLTEDEWKYMKGNASVYDLDGDGKITAEEYAQFIAQLRQRRENPQPAQTEDNTAEGTPRPRRTPRKPFQFDSKVIVQRLIEKYDTNGDGVLQKEEWMALPGQPEELDLNGDGIITAEEIEKSLTGGQTDEPAATEKEQPAAEKAKPESPDKAEAEDTKSDATPE